MEEGIKQRLLEGAASLQWQKIKICDHHGIVIPLFSLRSEQSCGIGEFLDLLKIIPWCQEIGFDIIQLLPLNDTGRESSPYSALSAFALNPIHLSLHQLPFQPVVSDLSSLPNFSSLNELPSVCYPSVFTFKDHFLRAYYQKYGEQLQKLPDYNEFKHQHRAWLDDYALFKALKVMQNWKSWEDWHPVLKNLPDHLRKELSCEVLQEMDYHIFLQYLCFQQWSLVKKVAKKYGVFLKGDLPILINRDSADVWSHRELFSLEFAAGAPPDMYALDGQKWGFPLYAWNEMKQQGYEWWIDRLAVASTCYDLYRIDHVVGFFRIWAIPLDLKATEGHFVPENIADWIPQGKELMLMLLNNSSMLPIGEDLGTIPPEVRVCLRSLGICGTKVMRWERDWHGQGEYIDPKNYPQESLTTVSTHDSETLAEWWRYNQDEAKAYALSRGWSYELNLKTDQHREILMSSHHSSSLFHINLLQEYLALVPGMTWPDINAERINIPGTVSDTNWSYRYKPFLEEIVNCPNLKQLMKGMY